MRVVPEKPQRRAHHGAAEDGQLGSAGQPRQIASVSDDGRQCVITAKAGTNPRYLCDTVGGSSGSPVIDRRSHRVRVLHNATTGSANQGNGIEFIWPRISAHFPGGVVPGGS